MTYLRLLRIVASSARDILQRRLLAPLQGPHVEDDRPPVVRRDLGGVSGHLAAAIGDRVEQLSNRLGGDDVGREVGRREPGRLLEFAGPLSNEAVPLADEPVARSAVDVELVTGRGASGPRSLRPGSP